MLVSKVFLAHYYKENRKMTVKGIITLTIVHVHICKPIPVTRLCKAKDYDRSFAEIADSNSAGGIF